MSDICSTCADVERQPASRADVGHCVPDTPAEILLQNQMPPHRRQTPYRLCLLIPFAGDCAEPGEYGCAQPPQLAELAVVRLSGGAYRAPVGIDFRLHFRKLLAQRSTVHRAQLAFFQDCHNCHFSCRSSLRRTGVSVFIFDGGFVFWFFCFSGGFFFCFSGILVFFRLFLFH